MLKGIKKIKENKVLKVIGNFLYAILCIIVILMLAVVIFQRVTDNKIAIGGYRMFTVITESMLPKYEVGDVLISKECNLDEINIGDDVVYLGKKSNLKDKIITHQVVSKEVHDGEYTFVTKGLANEQNDPEIKGDQVYGKIVYKVLILSFIGKLIQNIYVFYFLIFVPIAIIIYRQLRNIFGNHDDEEDDDKDENVKK